jgi:hypothetical protein
VLDNRTKYNSIRRKRLLGWWYIFIGAAFFVLGLFRLIIGERLWLVLLRLVVAAGFCALGYYQLRSAAGKGKETAGETK